MKFLRRLLLLISCIVNWLPQSLGAAPLPAAQTVVAHWVQADAKELVIEVTTPDYTLVQEEHPSGPCQRLEVAGFEQSGGAGAPQLPTVSSLIGLPPHLPFTFTVTAFESTLLPVETQLCPAPEAVAQESADGFLRYVEQPTAPDPQVYSQSTLYPATLVTGQDLGFLRSQRLARLTFSPFQVNPVTGRLLLHRRLRVQLPFGELAMGQSASVVEDEQWEAMLAATLLNYTTARAWRGQAVVEAASPMDTWRPPVNAYRVLLQEAGIYSLTYAELDLAGVPVSTIVPDHVQMYYNGAEIPIRVLDLDEDRTFDPGDKILFYGEAVQERYTHTNVYWLVLGDRPGKRMQISNGAAGTPISVTQHQATVTRDQNVQYVSSLPMTSDHDHWYESLLTATSGARLSDQRDFALEANEIVGGAATGQLEVTLAGNSKGQHHVRIYLNSQVVDEIKWSGRTLQRTERSFSQKLMGKRVNMVRVELINDTPNQVVDTIYVDTIRLRYQRNLVAQNDQLLFAAPAAGAWVYTVAGFSSAAVESYDVTEPTAVRLLPSSTVQGNLVFVDNQSTPRTYFTLETRQQRKPLAIVKANVADLLTPSAGADYLIIAHADFLAALEPLVAYRRRQGHTVRLVDVQQIYDQFNYGRMSAQAIHSFLVHAYSQWPAPKARLVLLVGDGNYDPHGYLPTTGPTFIPPYLAMVDPVIGETASDNRYAMLTGADLLPDVLIGRFPAQSSADVTAMVNKTIRYEQTAASANATWKNNLIFVTDNLEGGGGPFYALSDLLADGVVQTASGATALVPDSYQKFKFYLGSQCANENPAVRCRQNIVDQMNQGALFVSYIGHGAKEYWAEEQLLNKSALQLLNNGDRLPIMLPMTCLEGYFHEAAVTSAAFGETIVRMAEAGAVASWSPTGLGLATGHDYMERGFFEAYFQQEIDEVGAAILYGQLHLTKHDSTHKYDDLLDTFVLLGDPALRIGGSAQGQNLFLPVVQR